MTISRDSSLQATRTLLLERSGYKVIALGGDAEVRNFLKLLDQAAPNLILMCHSVPEKSRVALCSAIKVRYPFAPILMLYNGYDPTAALVDGRLENMSDPQALLDTVQVLLSPSGDKPV
jgi:DNA-binding NarL/FixJ family response regulator